MMAGTHTVRRTNASRATPIVRLMPNSATVRWLMRENARKTQIMIAAAAVMIRAVPACPARTARWLSPLRAHSSLIRLTRKTW